MRTLFTSGLVAMIAAAGVVALGSSPASAGGTGSSTLSNPSLGDTASGRSDIPRCSPMTTRSFTGTITGADGLYPDVTIGFDVKDKQGRNVDIADGCRKYGYSAIVQLNHYIDGQGAAPGTMQYNTATKYIPRTSQGLVSDTFTLENLPADADNVWIETYSRAYTGSPCGRRCAGVLDNSKYGQINRRAVKLSTGHITLTLPLTPAFGGRTGQLDLRLVGAHSAGVTIDKVYAWSMAPDGKFKNQGWGIGRPSADRRSATVPALGGGQKYVSWVYLSNGQMKIIKYKKVNSLKTTIVKVTV
jgi:hypothetical protein